MSQEVMPSDVHNVFRVGVPAGTFGKPAMPARASRIAQSVPAGTLGARLMQLWTAYQLPSHVRSRLRNYAMQKCSCRNTWVPAMLDCIRNFCN